MRSANDQRLYDEYAGAWWQAGHPFSASLQRLNRRLLALIEQRPGLALAGSRVADLGCGGGLLAIPLAAAGARVVGVDRSLPSLAAGRAEQARRRLSSPAWVRADAACLPLAPGWADLVLCCDLLEHVPDWRQVMRAAAALLRPGGSMLAVTLNRTWRARILAVWLAESLGLVPWGTHAAALFITPGELGAAAAAAGLASGERFGLQPDWLRLARSGRLEVVVGGGTGMLYGCWFTRPGPAPQAQD